MPPKIRNLNKTKIRVKQLHSLNIIKLDRGKQKYTENNIVETTFNFVKEIPIGFVKFSCL